MLVKPRTILGPILIGLAAMPSLFLTMDYFDQTRFFGTGAGRRLLTQPMTLLRGGKMEKSIGTQVQTMDAELFEHHAGSRIPLSWFVVAYFVLLGGFGIVEYCRRAWLEPALEVTEVIEPDTPDDAKPPDEKPGAGWVFPILLGFLMLGLYLLLANDLGSGDVLRHGGFLKTRLALLPPLVWLACLREPAHTPSAPGHPRHDGVAPRNKPVPGDANHRGGKHDP